MIIVKNGKIPNRIICFECDYLRQKRVNIYVPHKWKFYTTD